ncbi:protein BFR2 [Cryptococcus decagattii]|uniref:Protein BFR2 n=1 Tax=Cryptococcus decagattii TaxID=1859122 RepID=A0ABZ2B5C9_9TREE
MSLVKKKRLGIEICFLKSLSLDQVFIDLTHLSRERKKKREVERGGSKGRKFRYTVHEKAQTSVVPIPLSQGWHEEQADELFSLNLDVGNADDGLAELGGLRVF